MPNLVTLATGEVVDSWDDAWRDELFARWERVIGARGRTMGAVREMLAEVEQKLGDIDGIGSAIVGMLNEWGAMPSGGA